MGRMWESVRHVWMGRVLRECEECVDGEGVGGVKTWWGGCGGV